MIKTTTLNLKQLPHDGILVHLIHGQRELITVPGKEATTLILTIGTAAGAAPLVQVSGVGILDMLPARLLDLTEKTSYFCELWENSNGSQLRLASGKLYVGEAIAPYGTDTPSQQEIEQIRLGLAAQTDAANTAKTTLDGLILQTTELKTAADSALVQSDRAVLAADEARNYATKPTEVVPGLHSAKTYSERARADSETATTQAGLADADRIAAQEARQQSELNARSSGAPFRTTTAEGVSGTTAVADGAYFIVPTPGDRELYRNDAGVATFIDRLGITERIATEAEVKDNTSVKLVPVNHLISRLKSDGFLSVRHFDVKWDGSDETTRINTALGERVPLLFPKGDTRVSAPLDIQESGGILGSGERTRFIRAFTGGPVIRYSMSGEPIIIRDFQVTRDTVAVPTVADGDDGIELGFRPPNADGSEAGWAQRGHCNNLFINRQFDGFVWRRGSDGEFGNILSQMNDRYGFVGVNPRGVFRRCNANYNGADGYLMNYTAAGETGVDFDLCRSFSNKGWGWNLIAAAGIRGANLNMHRTVSSFDCAGGIRMVIPFTQIMITDHLAEYHGDAKFYRAAVDSTVADVATAPGLILNHADITSCALKGLKSKNNKGTGARLIAGEVDLNDWFIFRNGSGGVAGSTVGVEIGAAKVFGSIVRCDSDNASQTTDISITGAATGHLDQVTARHSYDAGSGSLQLSDVKGAMGNVTGVASAATIRLPRWGEFFKVTGATAVATINGGWPGRRVTLAFPDPGTTGGLDETLAGANIAIAGNFVATAYDTITLIFDGSSWFEVSRSGNV